MIMNMSMLMPILLLLLLLMIIMITIIPVQIIIMILLLLLLIIIIIIMIIMIIVVVVIIMPIMIIGAHADLICGLDYNDGGILASGGNDNSVFGRGDDAVGSPHRAQIVSFELFELVLLLESDKQFPVEQFEATVSQPTVSFPPLRCASGSTGRRRVPCTRSSSTAPL